MAGWLAAGCWLLRKEAGRQAGCVVSVVVAVVFAGGGRRAARQQEQHCALLRAPTLLSPVSQASPPRSYVAPRRAAFRQLALGQPAFYLGAH